MSYEIIFLGDLLGNLTASSFVSMNIAILVCAWLDTGIHQHQSQLLIGRHQVLCIAPNATPQLHEAACGEAALLLPLEFSVSHVLNPVIGGTASRGIGLNPHEIAILDHQNISKNHP